MKDMKEKSILESIGQRKFAKMRDGLIDELVENWLLLDQEDIEDVARVNNFDLHKDPEETDVLMEKCLIIAWNKKRGD